jgi:hypothetical protein
VGYFGKKQAKKLVNLAANIYLKYQILNLKWFGTFA